MDLPSLPPLPSARDRQLLIDLEDLDPLVTCTRYRLPVASADVTSAAPSSKPGDMLAQLRSDPLEAAWREINSLPVVKVSDGAEAGQPDAGESIRAGSATIVAASAQGQVKSRELWVYSFSGVEAGSSALDSLLEIKKTSFRLSDLFQCPRHGSSLSCLSVPHPKTALKINQPGPSQPCDVGVQPITDVREAWGRIAEAMLEKVAWQKGRRVSGTRLGPTVHVRADGKIVLGIPSRSRLSVRSVRRWVADDAGPSSRVLLPLGVPALCVGPFTPSPAQEEQLEASFTSLLGGAWTDGRSAGRLARSATGQEEAGWSILWVPAPGLATRNPAVHTPDWSALQQAKGLLTIWPAHLSLPHPSTDHQAATRRPPLPLLNVPSNDDLLSTSAALFDFISTYKPPSPEPAEPDDEEEDTPDQSGTGNTLNVFDGITPASIQPQVVPTPAPFPVAAPSEEAQEGQSRADGGGSDMDDLFSDHSPSPAPDTTAEPPLSADAQPTEPAMAQHDSPRIEGFEDLFGDTGKMEDVSPGLAPGTVVPEAENEPRDARAVPARFRGYMDGEAETEGQMVTEDDFDFFDSSPLQEPTGPPANPNLPAADLGTVAEPPDPTSPVQVEHPMAPDQPALAQSPLIPAPVPNVKPAPASVRGILSFGDIGSDELIGSFDVGAFDTFQAGQSAAQLELETDAYVPRRSSAASTLDTSLVVPVQREAIETGNKAGTLLDMRAPAEIEEEVDLTDGGHTHDTSGSSRRGQKRKAEDLDPEAALVDIETVPSLYSALDIPTSLTYTSYLLSPAQTPESHTLRPEMLEHLRSSAVYNLRGVDYAAQWETMSGSAADDDGLGATEDGEAWDLPPTPESEMGYSGSEESETDGEGAAGSERRKGRLADAAQREGRVFWGGNRAVGAELAVLMGVGPEEWDEGLLLDWDPVGGAKANGLPTPAPDDPATVAGPSETVRLVKKRLASISLDKLAREVVDNSVLRDYLLHSAIGSGKDISTRPLASALVQDLLDVPHVTASVSQEALRIHAGYGGNVAQLSIAALQYWRQIGLQPVGGPKDVALEVFCPVGDGMNGLAEVFVAGLRETWRTLGMGTLRVEEAGSGKGIVSVTEQGDEVVLEAAASRERESPLFTLIVPVVSDDLPFSALVPVLTPSYMPSATCIVHPLPLSALYAADYASLALAMYNRLPKPVLPVWTRPAFLPHPAAYLQHPSFTLAPDEPPKVEISLEWPLASYDILGRWRSMHLAYVWDGQLGVSVGMILDGAGEEWGVRTWAWPGVGAGAAGADEAASKERRMEMGTREWREVLQALWGWAAEWAGARAIEWRMAVCREGPMYAEELAAWQAIYETHRKPCSLLVTELPDRVELVGRPAKSGSTVLPAALADPSAKIVDLSLNGTSHTLPDRPVLRLPYSTTASPSASGATSARLIIPRSGFALSLDAQTASDTPSTTTYYVLLHRPVPGKEAEDADEALARDYYRLTCLARRRFGFPAAGAPVHLEGVRASVDAMWAYGLDGQ